MSSVASGGYFLFIILTQKNIKEIEKRERRDAKKIEIDTENKKQNKSTRKKLIRKKSLRKYKNSGLKKKDNMINKSDKKKSVKKQEMPSKKPLSKEEIIDRVQSIPPL
jgi:hypothetical protein